MWEKDRDKQEQEKLNKLKINLLLTNLPKGFFLIQEINRSQNPGADQELKKLQKRKR